MNPVPSPHDITALPYFPYVPGIAAWCALILVIALVLVWLRISARRRVNLSLFNPYRQALETIRALRSSQQAGTTIEKFVVERASSVLRHYLAAVTSYPIDKLSERELTEIKDREKKSLSLLLGYLIRIEELKYQNSSSLDLPRSLFSDIEVALMAYEAERSAEKARAEAQSTKSKRAAEGAL